jgi:lipopolysaccharide biosynthesis glycosyltransferase
MEIKKLKSLAGFNADYFILPKTKDPVEASMRKLKIYDYKNIDQYKNILFLDLDIVVVGDLAKMFEERTVPNIFYTSTQRCSHDLHKSVYHRLIEYSNEELERFAKNDIFAFNAGQFFFKNTSTMRKHFENINKMVDNWEGEYFFEQSFLNCYFNVLGLSNIFKFKEQFKFVAINEGEMNNIFNSEAVFVHFMGSAADASDKLFFIKKYYKHLL